MNLATVIDIRDEFSQFHMPIEIINSDDYVKLVFSCKNIDEYIKKSSNINAIIQDKYNNYMPITKKTLLKKPAHVSDLYSLNSLSVDSIKDSKDFDVRSGFRAFPFASILAPITFSDVNEIDRKEFVVFDNTGRIKIVSERMENYDTEVWKKSSAISKGNTIDVLLHSFHDYKGKIYDMKNN